MVHFRSALAMPGAFLFLVFGLAANPTAFGQDTPKSKTSKEKYPSQTPSAVPTPRASEKAAEKKVAPLPPPEPEKPKRQNELFPTPALLDIFSSDDLCKSKQLPGPIRINYDTKFPAFWVLKDKKYMLEGDEALRLQKLVTLMATGYVVPGVAAGEEPQFEMSTGGALTIAFQSAEADPDKPGQLRPIVHTTSDVWARDYYRQVKENMKFACLFNFNVYLSRNNYETSEKLYYSLELNGVRAPTDALETAIMEETRALMAGGSGVVNHLAIDKFNLLQWNHPDFPETGVVTVNFFIVKDGMRFRIGDSHEWAKEAYDSHLIHHARRLLSEDAKGLDRPLYISESTGPRVNTTVPANIPIERYLPYKTVRAVKNEMVGQHFDEVLEFIRTADPELAERLDKAMDETKVRFRPLKESLKNGPAESLPAVGRYVKGGVGEIAEIPWKRAERDPKKKHRAYVLLLILLEAIRGDKEDPGVREAYSEHLAEAFIKMFLGSRKPSREELEPLLLDYVTSAKTRRWQEIASQYANNEEALKKYLEDNRIFDPEVFREVQNSTGIVQDRAIHSLAEDYQALESKPLSITIPKATVALAKTYNATRILYWNSLNNLKWRIPMLDPAQYEEKEKALSVALELIFKKGVSAEQLQEWSRDLNR